MAYPAKKLEAKIDEIQADEDKKICDECSIRSTSDLFRDCMKCGGSLIQAERHGCSKCHQEYWLKYDPKRIFTEGMSLKSIHGESLKYGIMPVNGYHTLRLVCLTCYISLPR